MDRVSKINDKPIHFGWALVVLVAAVYFVRHLNTGDPSKILDYQKQTLVLETKEQEFIEQYSLKEVEKIEILKYIDGDYIHYELNLQLQNRRINLYASKDDLLIKLYALQLSKQLKKPIMKISTEL